MKDFAPPLAKGEATIIDSTNRVNNVSSSVNAVSSSFTTVDPGRERAQRNKFESVFGQDKDTNGNSTYKMFTPVNVAGSSYENLGKRSSSFKLQRVFLVDLPKGKRAIGTKWVYKYKKDERGIVVRNKARLVGQGYTQEKGIDVKSVFLYGTIEEEVYVCQPPGFEDPQFPDKVYKVEKALYGLHQAPRAWYETLSTYLLENGFRREIIVKTLFIKKERDDAQEILDEFYGGAHFLLRIASTIEGEWNLYQPRPDEEAEDVDVYLYRSMIGSLMYLTASRPDIMFVVCTCGFTNLTWKLFSDVIMLDASLQEIPQQKVLWIQNQMLDYGFNFMFTKIYIDNESTICIVKNLVFYSKINHIEMRNHFIRDSYEKKLIQVIKIHTNQNVADLLTKAFDISRFNFLVASIGLLNL
ncbi:putative ribonuclease H-like domain-containing protein [Tanacetum coccineum]